MTTAHRLISTSKRRHWASFWQCRRGVSSVEFALVVVPFLLLCFGFIAINAAFQTRSTMQNTAQLAARMMATGTVKNLSTGALSAANTTATTTCGGSLATTQVEYYACTGLPNWATYSVTATQNCAVPSVTVSIQATNFTAAVGDIYDFLLGKTITAQAVLMKEGPCP